MAVLAVLALGAGTTWALRGEDGAPSGPDAPDPASAARTVLPDLAPATGEPQLPGLASAAPSPGRVGRVAGPFDGRLRFTRLRLETARTAVSGRVTVTSDVSDVLELQVLAGFYDRQGRLLGTGRFTHHLDEEHHVETTGPPQESEAFRIRVPASLRDRVASAAVGVPVLVNE